MHVSPIYWLQQNHDWLLCACPIRWEFKKRGLAQPSRHPFSPAPLLFLSARPTEWETADGQTDGSGQDEAHSSFVLITIWHAGRGKQSARQPILTFLLDQYFITANFISNWYRDSQGAKDMGGDYQKYTAQIKSDSTYTLCTLWITTFYTLFILQCSPFSRLQLI